MSLKSIPEGAVEIQVGLWAVENHYTFNGQPRMRYDIYSSEGYCFWEIQQPENYDEHGALLPLEQREYATYMRTGYRTIEDLNSNFESVLYQEGYEIVSTVPNIGTV